MHLTGKPPAWLLLGEAGTSCWESTPGEQKAPLITEEHQLAQPTKAFRFANVKT